MKLETFLSLSKTSRADFARSIGVSEVAVCRYINGRFPRKEILEKIATATDGAVMPNDFLVSSDAACRPSSDEARAQ